MSTSPRGPWLGALLKTTALIFPLQISVFSVQPCCSSSEWTASSKLYCVVIWTPKQCCPWYLRVSGKHLSLRFQVISKPFKDFHCDKHPQHPSFLHSLHACNDLSLLHKSWVPSCIAALHMAFPPPESGCLREMDAKRTRQAVALLSAWTLVNCEDCIISFFFFFSFLCPPEANLPKNSGFSSLYVMVTWRGKGAFTQSWGLMLKLMTMWHPHIPRV